MADTGYVEALSGHEIIDDLVETIRTRLRSDCNLRDSDAYMGGYSAKISIHVECYGLDVVMVDSNVVVGTPQSDPDEIVHEDIEIAVETNLDLVRERSEQAVPTLSQDIEGKPEVKKRKYTRRVPLVGGATGEDLGE